MMIHSRTMHVAVLAGLLVALAGCSASDLVELIFPEVQGTWSYQATFTGCTGDITNLDGQTFNTGMTLQPICTPSAPFSVIQIDDLATIEPTAILCSDGSAAVLTGTVNLTETSVSGSWTAVGPAPGTMQLEFAGSVAGNVLSIDESRITYSGTLTGSCDLSPMLASTVTITP